MRVSPFAAKREWTIAVPRCRFHPRRVCGFGAKHAQQAHPGNRRVMAMYDKDLSNKWHVEIDFGDDETVTTLGDAYRNPKDSSQPMIGEEIAAARGLIALGTELLQRASSRIEQVTHQPVHLYR